MIPRRGFLKKSAISIGLLIILGSKLWADYSLELIATIPVGTDSTQITSITPVGDFNADGYNDLLIGEGPKEGDIDGYYEVAHLFYGGPLLDSIPDLVFKGASQGNFCDPLFACFACQADKLGDFNGDGFDDLAVGAPYYCDTDFGVGRVYIYFGGPNPDTTVDLILGGIWRPSEYFGGRVISGNYNGDALGDLLVLSGSPFRGSRFYIYLGSDPPDTVHDWLYDYGYHNYVIASRVFGGRDITGDGCADFGWKVEVLSNLTYFFLGGSPIPQNPIDSLDSYPPGLPGDVSEDGIEDFLLTYSNGEKYLFLGGSPLNLEPDYYVPASSYSFIYNMNDGVRKLASVSTFWDRILLYNSGVPLDTIPIDTISIPHFATLEHEKVGDINTDSTDDLAFLDTTLSYVYLYSILETTSIDREPKNPLEQDLLSCYPNPFNDAVTIVLDGNDIEQRPIVIRIYDIRGQYVKDLKASRSIGGRYAFLWDATDKTGKKVTSGIYFARVRLWRTPQTIKSVKLLYLK